MMNLFGKYRYAKQSTDETSEHEDQEPKYNKNEETIELIERPTATSTTITQTSPTIVSHDQQWVTLSALVDDEDHSANQTYHQYGDGTDAVAESMTHHVKQQLYLLLEAPSSSRAAFWINVVVSMLIVLSAVMTTMETIPAFRSEDSNRLWQVSIYYFILEGMQNKRNSEIKLLDLFQLEVAMVSLFTLEYLLRVFAHSDSLGMIKHFFLSPLSIIDFISIVPFYIELLAKRDTTYEFRFTILRLFRLLRLFKTYQYSNTIAMTIEVLVLAMRRSSDALSALFFFLVTSVVLFSTLLYFAERGVWDSTVETFVNPGGNPSSFDSIPAAFWFVLVTITTTGYGDMVPATFIGKLVTFPAMMFGVLLIALPSIIVGRNFTTVWEIMRRHEQPNHSEPDRGPYWPHNRDALANARQEAVDALPGRTSFEETKEALAQLERLTGIARQHQEALHHIMALIQTQDTTQPLNRDKAGSIYSTISIFDPVGRKKEKAKYTSTQVHKLCAMIKVQGPLL
ncbi:hypothetical protein J3Q64DRAFT_1821395 [Phycomyces blakesleeanus]|uniref:Ion transport domain-containing protein n=2 Tax=Phycomyces blakesleeanus TaxID=4837 RepID=A0A167N8D6_PHYB8|nr:hypothetical protein PHYBLDRAFT_64244 [Phycomyces blakesleeanus NRRL 1555(-)]OAD75319.1 hypothetical protein PHYBLDRAFT_64244 [Phycomyces blakesleeanus NRRL 1555(-)]|eukprot:XP_018293359.1 hypothetical protein PHYBLDRAFT_64244 [Phycomyces blakesleeanus NRRL 1555(-)]